MARASTSTMLPIAITMEDDLGIMYLVETAQQFWSELEDILKAVSSAPTLALLDSTLKRFLALCAAYHEQYLQSPLQLEHALNMLLDSELFTFHSERMCEILIRDTQESTNPHSQLIFYHVLFAHGRRRSDFFRSHKRWRPLLPLLMDHVRVEIAQDVEDVYFGVASSSQGSVHIVVPVEAKLRTLSVRLLYEVARVQTFASITELRMFDDEFIDYLFDLVEQTRNMHDETFNYSVIKLIVALNEQFMVASVSGEKDKHTNGKSTHPHSNGVEEQKNRVLIVLMRRLGSSKTFGENMIFMLNRAGRTPEDACMQLLVLKLLYLLFTTKGTAEDFFYTNDLRVLVDVFLRELVDLDEDSESLRHTYLRVLHPLLTKTQLRSIPYKRPQIVSSLESLIQNARIRDVSPTTQRLVERCLSGDWCTAGNLRTKKPDVTVPSDESRGASPSNASVAAAARATTTKTNPGGKKTLKTSKSMEFSKGGPSSVMQVIQPVPLLPSAASHHTNGTTARSTLDTVRRGSNASASSLSGVAAASMSTGTTSSPRRQMSVNSDGAGHISPVTQQTRYPPLPASPATPDTLFPGGFSMNSTSLPTSPTLSVTRSTHAPHRRTAPPAPTSASTTSMAAMTNVVEKVVKEQVAPKRRKPPAIPVGRNHNGHGLGSPNGGVTMTTIKSSSPLAHNF